MKNLILIFIIVFFSTALFAQETETEVVRLSEPVQVTETHEIFGAEVSEWNEGMDLVSIIKSSEELAGKEITLETKVAEVCQKKGCFFVANQDGYTARITFKDYGFFIPTDALGKTVRLVGTFEVKELSEDQAKHYAEDAGNDPNEVEGTQKEYSIVATSVMVPKSK